MEKKTLNVAFSTQKGGAGKTTLTVLVASYLHYVRGYNVAVIDCDFPQHSIAEMRERDMQMTMDDEHYKLMAYEQFSALGKKAYEVIESSPENAMEDAQDVIEELKPDFVFLTCPELSTILRLSKRFRLWITLLLPLVLTAWCWKVPCNM